MKRKIRTFCLAPCWGMGVALLALCAFIPLSRADVVVVNNTGADFTTVDNAGSATTAGDYIGELFDTGVGGSITSLALQLNAANEASASVWITPNLIDSSTFVQIGTITANATGLVNVDLGSTYTLAADTSYTVFVEPTSGALSWDITTTSGSGGDGTVVASVESTDSGNSWSGFYTGGQMQMYMTVVPEVPITGAFMGFGALAIIMGTTVCRKIRLAVFCIA